MRKSLCGAVQSVRYHVLPDEMCEGATCKDELGGDQLVAAVYLARDEALDLHQVVLRQIPAPDIKQSLVQTLWTEGTHTALRLDLSTV